jgi:glutathione S-transferase
MITVCHLKNSRSTRILWLLEELGLEYQVEYFQRDPGMRAPAAMTAIDGLGRSPIVRMDGEVLGESGAIIDLILRRHPESALAPKDGDADFSGYLFFLHYAEGSLSTIVIPLLVNRLIPGDGVRTGIIVDFLRPEADRHLDFVERKLSGRAFIAGDRFTGADIQMAPMLQYAGMIDLLGARPAIHAYLEKVLSRPAYQAALKHG